ncbi:MAG: UvrD-helicase domain-containing protein [Candidatus Eisenbacteria bacterium]|nr:UvrD-helicase domain-containing protein [Candidatus Eisenbacteria bacterium]
MPHKDDFRMDLNSVQLKAVRHVNGPLLVLAGAGSGKTRVLTYRVAYLIRELGVSPRRILAVTFTNKAAEEMKRRVTELVGGGAGSVWIGTFHSVCARILRLEADWGWWSRSFSIYDETDQVSLVKTCMEKVGVSTSVFSPKAVLAAISRAKDELLTADEYGSSRGGYFEECVARIYAEYEKKLMESNAFDFDDLIMRAVSLLRTTPEVLDAYAHRFEHVLVDEYQDTSHAQYALVNLLSSRHRNICVVGDDDQSIYGWRGADITNILDFEQDHADAVVLRLEQNYRSTSNILEAAHDVVSHNERRKEKKLWTERGEGAPVSLTRASNEYQEADAIRDMILSLSAEGCRDYREFAILYRTHAQSRVLEDSLRRAGIPYDIVGGVRFYERSEVKDALAYARVVSNPSDSVSLARIVNVPPRRIGGRSLEYLERFAEHGRMTLLEALRRGRDVEGLPPAAAESGEALAGAIDRAREKAETQSADAVIQALLEESGYLDWLHKGGTEESSQRLANVEELISAANEFVEASGEASLDAFLEQVSLVSNIDRWKDGANAVSLMTLHNAKGLEFGVVLIPGLEDGLLPHESAFADDEELEEERRLLYVGMTRAKDELRLLTSDTRRRLGTMDVRVASRFIDEIDTAHLRVEAVPPRAIRGGAAVPGRRGGGSSGGRGASRGRPTPGGWRGGGGSGGRSDSFPDYENFSQEEFALKPGARVVSPRWGKGVILEISGVAGDAVVRVRFDDDVEKRIMLRYGKLEVIAD